MACNCVKEWSDLLKERLNHTAAVNHDMISGRVVIKGVYHKLKKDGTYNSNRWEEVNLWPKFCPFCGKPYDENED
jgi:hypothetical protein